MLAALKLVLKDRPQTVALLIGLATQIFLMIHLQYPSKIMFDETHYVPAAQAILDLSAPRNIEHPMLGKELIALGMLLFGDNPWGWRLIPSLAGSATVVAGFSFLWLLTRRMRPALIGAMLMVLSQLLFIQARIGMLDVFLGAFLMWGLVLMTWAMRGTPKQVLWRWTGASVLLGLAMAVKWSALPYIVMAGLAFAMLQSDAQAQRTDSRLLKALAWGLVGLALCWLGYSVGNGLIARVDAAGPPDLYVGNPSLMVMWYAEPAVQILMLPCLLAGLALWWPKAKAAFAAVGAKPVRDAAPGRWPGLGVIPGLAILGVVSLLVYFTTFLPAFFYADDPMTLSRLIPFQWEMYQLQTQVLKPHPYQSNWETWPLMLRPIWYFYEMDAGAQRGVLLIGNPVVMWGGLVALAACLWAWIREKAKRPMAVALLWIASVAIYILIPKSLGFYYYYYLSSLFLCFVIAVAFDHYDRGKGLGREEWFVAASFLVFCYFYPVLSAWALNDGGSFTNWTWLPNWR